MKNPFIVSIVAAMALMSVARAETASTAPAGFTTYKLGVGLNAIGMNLLPSPIATGKFTLNSGFGNVLTDLSASYQVTEGRTYVLDILTGELAGTVLDLPSSAIDGNTITVSSSTTMEQLGLASGDRYQLRVANTLEEIFGTNSLAEGGVLRAALNTSNADIIWIPTSDPNVFNKYMLHPDRSFKRVTGTGVLDFVSDPNVPIIYSDGILVEKKTSTPASVVFQGHVKKRGTNSIIQRGYNLISIVSPSGLTLRTAGFENYITSSLNVGNADIIWVQDPMTLAYTQYFHHPENEGSWRIATGVTGEILPLNEDPPLRGAIYIQRKRVASVNLKMETPEMYSYFGEL
ncbi:MAG: hypothetical protein QM627_07670 [Luteolibacter sp.]